MPSWVKDEAKWAKAQPTPAQAEAGNYRKKHIRFQGMAIAIENPRGSVRRGRDRGGHEWAVKMMADYGYINGSMGVDGDQVDVYIGPDPDADTAYLVTTMAPPSFTKKDEQKCMLGYASEAAAKAAFLAHYDNPKFFGSMLAMPMDEFKTKVLATKDAPKLIKGDIRMEDISRRLGDFGQPKAIIFFKSYVRPTSYVRNGKTVQRKGYTDSRTRKAEPAKGGDPYTMDLFSAPEKPPLGPSPFSEEHMKHPEKFTGDLFDGGTGEHAKARHEYAARAEADYLRKMGRPVQAGAAQNVYAAASARYDREHGSGKPADSAHAEGDKDRAKPQERDGFRALLENIRREHQSKLDAIGDIGDGAILADKGGTRFQMVLPDASEPGKWRTQSFGADGFWGHMTFNSKQEALDDAVKSGYYTRDDEALDRLQDTHAFQRGNFAADLIRRVNGKEISMEEGNRRLAEYDQKHARAKAADEQGTDHPAPIPSRTIAGLSDADRAEWLQHHRQQHELTYYEMPQVRAKMDKVRSKKNLAESEMRQQEAHDKDLRGSGLPGSIERADQHRDAADRLRKERKTHADELDRLSAMHQQLYETAGKHGRAKHKLVPESDDLRMDFMAMKRRDDKEEAKYAADAMKQYRSYYKGKTLRKAILFTNPGRAGSGLK